MGLMDKVKGIVSKNSEKITTGIDKAGDVIDKKTGGKYAAKIDKAQDAAAKAVGKLDDTPKPADAPTAGDAAPAATADAAPPAAPADVTPPAPAPEATSG